MKENDEISQRRKFPIRFEIDGYTCYASKNNIDGWVAYVDVTDFPELHSENFAAFSELPFHGGCTFCGWTSCVGSEIFDSERFLIGCDWCHGVVQSINSSQYVSYHLAYKNFEIVELASEDEVIENIKDVVSKLPELRLKRMIMGDGLV